MFGKVGKAVTNAAKGAAESKKMGPMGVLNIALMKSKASKPPAKAKGMMGAIGEAMQGKKLTMKKGGMAKKSSDAMGRAVTRKTADVKGRAMKKGK